MSHDLGAICSGMMVWPVCAGTGEMTVRELAVQPNAVGPIPRANTIIAPEELLSMLKAMAVDDPVKAHLARVRFEEWLDSTFPCMGDLYMASPTMPGRSVAEAKLVRLGMLD